MRNDQPSPAPHRQLLDAIPRRYQPTIEMHARVGAADPYLAAAKDAWFRCALMGNYQLMSQASADLEIGCRDVPTLLRERDALFGALGEVTRATINENTATQGGNLVPTFVEADLVRLLNDAGLVRRLTRQRTMASKTGSIPKPGAMTSYVLAESGTDTTAGEPRIDNVSLTAKSYIAYGLVTWEAFQDSVIGIAELYAQLAAEAYGAQEDQLALEGTAGAAVVGLVATSGVNTMDATTATNTSAVPTYAQLVKMVATAGKRVSRRRGAFFFHPTAWSNIAGQLGTSVPTIGVQPPLWQDAEADGYAAGYPVYCTEQIAGNRTDVGGTDVSYGYFGNFADGLQIVDRPGTLVEASADYKAQSGLIGVRMLKRTAIAVGLPAAFTWLKKVKAS